MLAGYKTYIVAGVSIIGAVAGYLVGDVALMDAFQIIVTALSAAGIRNAIK